MSAGRGLARGIQAGIQIYMQLSGMKMQKEQFASQQETSALQREMYGMQMSGLKQRQEDYISPDRQRELAIDEETRLRSFAEQDRLKLVGWGEKQPEIAGHTRHIPYGGGVKYYPHPKGTGGKDIKARKELLEEIISYAKLFDSDIDIVRDYPANVVDEAIIIGGAMGMPSAMTVLERHRLTKGLGKELGWVADKASYIMPQPEGMPDIEMIEKTVEAIIADGAAKRLPQSDILNNIHEYRQGLIDAGVTAGPGSPVVAIARGIEDGTIAKRIAQAVYSGGVPKPMQSIGGYDPLQAQQLDALSGTPSPAEYIWPVLQAIGGVGANPALLKEIIRTQRTGAKNVRQPYRVEPRLQ